MTDWVRLWHDMPTDPKWRTIARKSGQRVGDVIAVFTFMMINASANTEARGTISGLATEDIASALDMDEEEVVAILDAMTGRVISDGRLTGWEKRQPKREDSGVGARVAKHRETKRAERETQRNADVTTCNAPETETETETERSKKKEARERVRVEKPDPFPCPEGVDLVDWDALKSNRRTKRAALTEGAHRQIVRKLEGWSRDGWPPGPIVAFAAERGWTSVFETDEMKALSHGIPRNTNSFANLRGSRPDPALDMLLEAERDIQAEAEREGQVVDFPARTTLPPR